jgi:hypothetical protein
LTEHVLIIVNAQLDIAQTDRKKRDHAEI